MNVLKKFRFAVVIIFAVGLILLIALAFRLELYEDTNTYSDPESILSGWTDENEDSISLYCAFKGDTKEKTFTRYIDGSKLNGRSLCLVAHNILFTVTLDGEKLYEYHPKLGGIYGVRYGESVHTILLPSFTGRRELMIEATSLRFDGTSGCSYAYFDSSRDFIHTIAHSEAVKFILCAVTLFFGIILFLIGIVEDKLSGKMLEPICLGSITLTVSAWIGSQTLIMRILSNNPAMLRVIEYLSLAVLPIPVLMFYASITNNMKNKGVITAVFACTLNALTTLILVCCGVLDYSDMLFVTHITIILGAAMIIYLIIKVIVRKEMSRSKTIYFSSALIVLTASGMLDLLRYYFARSKDFSFVTLIGLLFFAVILAIYEYKNIIEMKVKSSKAELMQTLAMSDTLTGLGSRAAFVAHENKLLKKENGKCLFVHFDVNFLKQVNDEYGHAEGDKHLKETARVLKESFGSFGDLYRVGGDEFFAILDGENCISDYEIGLEKLKKAQLDYNTLQSPPVQLEIAYGMAEYDYSLKDPETSERLADSRMYECKRRLKGPTVNA